MADTTNAVRIEPPAIEETYRVIAPFIRRTPVVEIDGADLNAPGARLTLKLEFMQHAGAFKTRGAFANLLLRDIPAAGVVAASGGNHGTAVAYAAMRRGVRAHIFVPRIASPAKIQRIRDYGAELVVGGDFYGEALVASEAYRAQSGALPIHAFDQAETLLGQGTVGLELAQQANVDTVLMAVGGGGLMSGIASWFGGRVKIVAIEPEEAPTLSRAFAAGKPVDAPAGGIAADSLAPYRVGELVYPIAKQFVSEIVLVNDQDIRNAQQELWNRLRIVVEPGGATATSALLSRKYVPARGERVALILSGANTTAVAFS